MVVLSVNEYLPSQGAGTEEMQRYIEYVSHVIGISSNLDRGSQNKYPEINQSLKEFLHSNDLRKRIAQMENHLVIRRNCKILCHQMHHLHCNPENQCRESPARNQDAGIPSRDAATDQRNYKRLAGYPSQCPQISKRTRTALPYHYNQSI